MVFYVHMYCFKRGIKKACLFSSFILRVSGTGEEDGTLVCAVTDITARFVATSCSDKSIAIVDLTTGNIVANLAGERQYIT